MPTGNPQGTPTQGTQGTQGTQQTPITLEQAKALTHRTVLYHVTHRNADGSAQRWRVNGRVKLWKRSPDRVRVPLMYGYVRAQYDYLTEDNLADYSLEDVQRV